MSDTIFRVEVQREEAVVSFGAQGAFVVGRVAVVSGEALQVDQVSATLEEDARLVIRIEEYGSRTLAFGDRGHAEKPILLFVGFMA